MKRINPLYFLALNALCLVAAIYCLVLFDSPAPVDPFANPYKVTILDDHSVQLASKSDTLVLLLENSATFNDEFVVFIKK